MAQLLTGTRIYGTGTVDTQLFVSGANTAASTTTGALQVRGGTGIGGNLYVGGTTSSFAGQLGVGVTAPTSKLHIYSTGTSTSTVSDGTEVFQTIENSANGTMGIYGIGLKAQGGVLQAGINAYNLAFGGGAHLTFWTKNTSAVYAERVRITSEGSVIINATTSATSTSSGALQVVGGAGIGGALYVANTSYIAGAQVITTATIGQYAAAGASTGTTSTFLINNATISTGTNSGALQVVGGVGVGGNVYVGGIINIALGQYATFGSNTSTRITRDGALNGLDLQTSATSRLFIADTDGAVTIRSTAISTSTMTGALVVKGGAGIGGNVYISGTSYVNNSQILTSATIYSYTALRGQYIPRTAYVSTGTITIDASQYDTYVVTATNASSVIIQINTDNGYTPFDGQKLIIRLRDDGTARRLYFNYNSNHFRVVGIAPPAITLSNSTIYVGAMYNQSVARWDILSAVIQ
jgi:hypothetical protein